MINKTRQKQQKSKQTKTRIKQTNKLKKKKKKNPNCRLMLYPHFVHTHLVHTQFLAQIREKNSSSIALSEIGYKNQK